MAGVEVDVGDEHCSQQVGHHQGQAKAKENIYEREEMVQNLSEKAWRSD